MSLVVEKNILPDPGYVRFLGPVSIMLAPDSITNLIQKFFRLLGHPTLLTYLAFAIASIYTMGNIVATHTGLSGHEENQTF